MSKQTRWDHTARAHLLYHAAHLNWTAAANDGERERRGVRTRQE
jgi:hypothetical protein